MKFNLILLNSVSYLSVGYSGGGVVKLDLRSKDKNKLDKLPGTIELLLGKFFNTFSLILFIQKIISL